MDIVGFCDFVIFPSRRNILILQSCAMLSKIVEILSLIREYRHDWPNHVKTLVHLYVILNLNQVDFEYNYLLIF